MGDYVIRNLIEETPHAAIQMKAWLQQKASACEVYVVVADEEQRSNALKLTTDLRGAGVSADLPLTATKVAKQFKLAEKAGARFALVIGNEFPEVQLKNLASRSEQALQADSAIEAIQKGLSEPDGPLLA